MASSIHSNPVYYSLASLSSRQNPPTKTVVLHKRPDHNGFGVYIGEDVPSGLYIVTVERNSPASDADIQPGDRVLAINGQAVSSMSTNPKDTLIKAATNSQSLSLTVQSTDIYQTLDIPLANSTKDNHTHQKRKHHSSARILNHNADLEGYIKSLFGNEDIQILPASNHNEFILKSDSYPKSSINFNSFPIRSHHSSHHKKHHRQPKQTLLQTRQTQTSIDYDPDENTLQEQSETSPSRQHSAHPSMGKSQLILRAQQQTTTDNTVRDLQQPGFSANNDELDFMPLPPSPIMNQTALPVQPAAAASSSTPNKMNPNSTTNDTNITQMADAVTAAMAASRKKDQPNGREQVASREQVPTTRRPITPPPSREQVSSAKQERFAPPSNRPTESSSRESASVPKRITTPPQNRNAPPPPYTPIENRYESSKPVDNRNSVNQGASNPRNSVTNQSTTPSERQNTMRDVLLRRVSDFQGFGFHLQYNKVYYLVQRVEAGSPAENGGLRPNDVILSINQQSTTGMIHERFVEIVNGNTNVTFLVQSLEDYLRANPQRVRTQPTIPTVTAAPPIEPEKPKSSLSKALGKLTNR